MYRCFLGLVLAALSFASYSDIWEQASSVLIKVVPSADFSCRVNISGQDYYLHNQTSAEDCHQALIPPWNELYPNHAGNGCELEVRTNSGGLPTSTIQKHYYATDGNQHYCTSGTAKTFSVIIYNHQSQDSYECPKDQPEYDLPKDIDGDSVPDVCYSSAELQNLSGCANMPDIVTGEGSSSVCVDSPSGGLCRYNAQDDGLYFKDYETSCFNPDLPDGDNLTPSEIPEKAPESCIPHMGYLICDADPSICLSGSCPKGCGYANTSAGEQFICFTTDSTGDGIPDNDYDGDGLPDYTPNDPAQVNNPCIGGECGFEQIASIMTGVRSDLGGIYRAMGSGGGAIGGGGTGSEVDLTPVIDAINDTRSDLGEKLDDLGEQLQVDGSAVAGELTGDLKDFGSMISGWVDTVDGQLEDQKSALGDLFDSFKSQAGSLLDMNLSSSASLPCLGSIDYAGQGGSSISKQICLEEYATELNQIGLGLLFISFLFAMVIIMR